MADNNRVNSNFFQIAKTDVNDDVWGVNVDVANLQINGGTAGQVLTTNGVGNLSWTTGSGGSQQPLIEFPITVAGSGQTFTDALLATFTNNTYASVYINGVLLKASEYSITGTTLTVNSFLNIADTVTVGATGAGGSGGGGSGTVTSVATGGSGLGFSLSGGPITTTGTVTLATPTDTALRTTLNIGNVANTNFNANGSEVLAGNGAWVAASTGTVTSIATGGSGLGFSLSGGPISTTGTVTLATPTDLALRTTLNIGNVANTNYNGNGLQVLAGNGAWVTAGGGGTPAGANTQIQFNDSGVFGAANITFNKINDSFTIGGGANVGTAVNAMAIGAGSVARAANAMAIGAGSVAIGANAVAIGAYAGTDSVNSMAIGTSAYVSAANGVAIGTSAYVSAANSVAIGTEAQATVANTIVLGTAVYTTSIPGITNAANIMLNEYQETVTAFTSTGTGITPDFNNATIFQYTATDNFTFNGFLNAVAGKNATVIIKQDAIGGRLMTSTMAFSGGLKTLSTAPNATDIVYVFYSGTTYYASLVTGYA
jgi:hypothetical protein